MNLFARQQLQVCTEKQAALAAMLQSGSVPLRSGVKDVIVDALEAGATVAWIAGTDSTVSLCDGCPLVVYSYQDLPKGF